MAQIEGGCLCGAIRYLCVAPAVKTINCHCRNCQRQSGSAFSVNLMVPKGALRISQGETKVFEDCGSSGRPVYRHFCGRCGSPIFSDLAVAPDWLFLKAGTLDDGADIVPTANLWCVSAQAWVPYQEGVPRFERGPA